MDLRQVIALTALLLVTTHAHAAITWTFNYNDQPGLGCNAPGSSVIPESKP